MFGVAGPGFINILPVRRPTSSSILELLATVRFPRTGTSKLTVRTPFSEIATSGTSNRFSAGIVQATFQAIIDGLHKPVPKTNTSTQGSW